ncbi:MAG: isochorismatase family protein, partial [Oscillospiraceae bacterium]|nr:isochorismatase family protein [Oscillospiraceae bacterium]
THQENYLDTREGSVLPVVHCVKGTKGHELDPVVAEALGSSYFPVEKNTFGSKDLPLVIADKTDISKIEEFDIIGVCTDICVISNAMILRAHFPEVPIKIISDCCAGVTPESHRNALNAMAACQFIVE